jgi:hypothetical protein
MERWDVLNNNIYSYCSVTKPNLPFSEGSQVRAETEIGVQGRGSVISVEGGLAAGLLHCHFLHCKILTALGLTHASALFVSLTKF